MCHIAHVQYVCSFREVDVDDALWWVKMFKFGKQSFLWWLRRVSCHAYLINLVLIDKSVLWGATRHLLSQNGWQQFPTKFAELLLLWNDERNYTICSYKYNNMRMWDSTCFTTNVFVHRPHGKQSPVLCTDKYTRFTFWFLLPTRTNGTSNMYSTVLQINSEEFCVHQLSNVLISLWCGWLGYGSLLRLQVVIARIISKCLDIYT